MEINYRGSLKAYHTSDSTKPVPKPNVPQNKNKPVRSWNNRSNWTRRKVQPIHKIKIKIFIIKVTSTRKQTLEIQALIYKSRCRNKVYFSMNECRKISGIYPSDLLVHYLKIITLLLFTPALIHDH